MERVQGGRILIIYMATVFRPDLLYADHHVCRIFLHHDISSLQFQWARSDPLYSDNDSTFSFDDYNHGLYLPVPEGFRGPYHVQTQNQCHQGMGPFPVDFQTAPVSFYSLRTVRFYTHCFCDNRHCHSRYFNLLCRLNPVCYPLYRYGSDPTGLVYFQGL